MSSDAEVVIVSGGASGLGLATASRLVAVGTRVLVLDLPSSRGEQVASGLGVLARFTAGDVTVPADVEAAAAAAMAANEPAGGQRGACVLTSSIAAFEGQIGQIPYAAAKAGIVGMTLVAARDLAQRGIRVCAIAPGLFDTPLLGQLRDDVRQQLAAGIPSPQRLGDPEEFAHLATAILANHYLNGETIRLDGAWRMAPR
jgi:NAD(P)-dependent dehydrogenase (short-subunit alcohol dehydrogenase family)